MGRDGFPKWRLLNRVVIDTEAELASLPMVLVTPVVAAVAGAVVAFVYTPAEHVHDGVVETPSLWPSLGLAASGAVLGIGFVILVLSLWFWLSYLYFPDRLWRLQWTDSAERRAFRLLTNTFTAAQASDLADLEIWLKCSDGPTEIVTGDVRLFPGGGPKWVFDQSPVARDPQLARVYSHQPGKRPYEVLRTTVRADPGPYTPTRRPWTQRGRRRLLFNPTDE